MVKCKCCGKPVDAGVVLHPECYSGLKMSANFREGFTTPTTPLLEWIDDYGRFKCPHCGKEFHDEWILEEEWMHCPGCGRFVLIPEG